VAAAVDEPRRIVVQERAGQLGQRRKRLVVEHQAQLAEREDVAVLEDLLGDFLAVDGDAGFGRRAEDLPSPVAADDGGMTVRHAGVGIGMPFSGSRPSVVLSCSTIAFPMFFPSMKTSCAIGVNYRGEKVNSQWICGMDLQIFGA